MLKVPVNEVMLSKVRVCSRLKALGMWYEAKGLQKAWPNPKEGMAK